MANYLVNGEGFQSFSAAVKTAQAAGVIVVDGVNGLTRWTPAKPAKKSGVRHVFVAADGTRTLMGNVRQGS